MSFFEMVVVVKNAGAKKSSKRITSFLERLAD